MKIKLLALCVLWSAAAFGQVAASGVTNQPQITEFTSHPERAARQPMREEQNLWGDTPYSYGHGERPLWEVALPSTQKSLGNVARTYKKEHENAKKADVVWVN